MLNKHWNTGASSCSGLVNAKIQACLEGTSVELKNGLKIAQISEGQSPADLEGQLL